MKSAEEFEADAIEAISRSESLEWHGKEIKATIFDVVSWAKDQLSEFKSGPIDCTSHGDSMEFAERMILYNLLSFIYGED